MRLIDADELIRKIRHEDKDGIYWEIYHAPTIEAESVIHGKWEHGREISRHYIGDACIDVHYEDWKCSNCGIVCEQSDKPKYKYCPVCGAKMDEVEE